MFHGRNRGWDGWMASPTQWTRVWVSSGSWWWKGKPGVLQSMGSQRVGSNLATELNWSVVFDKPRWGNVASSSPKYKSPLMLYLKIHEAQIVCSNISLSHRQRFFFLIVCGTFLPLVRDCLGRWRNFNGLPNIVKENYFSHHDCLLHLGGQPVIFSGNFVLLFSFLELWKISVYFLLKC